MPMTAAIAPTRERVLVAGCPVDRFSFEETVAQLSVGFPLLFHMHEEASVLSVRDGEAEVAWRVRNIQSCSPDYNAYSNIICGFEGSKLVWRSRRFNQKQPIDSLQIHSDIDGPTAIRTHLRVKS